MLEPREHVRRHGERGLRRREPGGRRLPARQHLLPHPARRAGPRCASRTRGGSRPPSRSGSGEAPARSDELSAAVSRLRAEVERRLEQRAARRRRRVADARRVGVAEPRPTQIVDYLARGARRARARCRRSSTLVFERFFDEAGGMQLVHPLPLRQPHQPRLGPGAAQALLPHLQLRAAGRGHRRRDRPVARTARTASRSRRSPATCTPTSVRRAARPGAARRADVPTRWRWNASVALALLRFRGGKKVPPPLQRMEAEDLLGRRLPRPARLRREPRRRARDPRPSAGAARRSTTACTRRWTSRAWSALLRSARGGRDRGRRARPDRALAARARGADRAALRLPRRRAARGAAHAGGHEPGAGSTPRAPPTSAGSIREAIARVRDEAWPDADERRRAARRAGVARRA